MPTPRWRSSGKRRQQSRPCAVRTSSVVLAWTPLLLRMDPLPPYPCTPKSRSGDAATPSDPGAARGSHHPVGASQPVRKNRMHDDQNRRLPPPSSPFLAPSPFAIQDERTCARRAVLVTIQHEGSGETEPVRKAPWQPDPAPPKAHS